MTSPNHAHMRSSGGGRGGSTRFGASSANFGGSTNHSTTGGGGRGGSFGYSQNMASSVEQLPPRGCSMFRGSGYRYLVSTPVANKSEQPSPHQHNVDDNNNGHGQQVLKSSTNGTAAVGPPKVGSDINMNVAGGVAAGSVGSKPPIEGNDGLHVSPPSEAAIFDAMTSMLGEMAQLLHNFAERLQERHGSQN